MSLLKMADMQQNDMIIKRHKWGWIYPCNGILWIVLGEERGDPARRGDELRKRSARTKKKPGLI